MLKEVGYMDLTRPTKLLSKAHKALKLNHLANQRIRLNREVTLAFDFQNPLESVETVREQMLFKRSKFVRQKASYFQTPPSWSTPFKQQNCRSFGHVRMAAYQQQTNTNCNQQKGKQRYNRVFERRNEYGGRNIFGNQSLFFMQTVLQSYRPSNFAAKNSHPHFSGNNYGYQRNFGNGYGNQSRPPLNRIQPALSRSQQRWFRNGFCFGAHNSRWRQGAPQSLQYGNQNWQKFPFTRRIHWNPKTKNHTNDEFHPQTSLSWIRYENLRQRRLNTIHHHQQWPVRKDWCNQHGHWQQRSKFCKNRKVPQVVLNMVVPNADKPEEIVRRAGLMCELGANKFQPRIFNQLVRKVAIDI